MKQGTYKRTKKLKRKCLCGKIFYTLWNNKRYCLESCRRKKKAKVKQAKKRHTSDIFKECSNNKFQKLMTINSNRAIKASQRRMKKRGMILIKRRKA